MKNQNPTFLLKDLYEANKTRNEKVVNHVNDGLVNVKNAISRKETTENEKPHEVINIVEKIIEFNEKHLGIGIKVLTSKQLFQRLPVALAQVKSGNTSETLLNEIRQIICSLYQTKEII